MQDHRAHSSQVIARLSRRSTCRVPSRRCFFAPDQIRKRAKEWGPGGIDRRFGAAWPGFAPKLDRWLRISEAHGPARGAARPISIPSTAAFRRNRVISCRCRNRRHLVTAFLRPSRMGIGSRNRKTPRRRPVARNAHARQDGRHFGCAPTIGWCNSRKRWRDPTTASLKTLFHPTAIGATCWR